MTEEEHTARIEEAREFYTRQRDFWPEDSRPDWLKHVQVLLEEIDRDAKIIEAVYDGLGPAADDIMDMIYEEVDA